MTKFLELHEIYEVLCEEEAELRSGGRRIMTKFLELHKTYEALCESEAELRSAMVDIATDGICALNAQDVDKVTGLTDRLAAMADKWEEAWEDVMLAAQECREYIVKMERRA